MPMLLGETVSDEAYANWQGLSNANKLVLIHEQQQREAAASRAAPVDKPKDWKYLGSADRIAWIRHQRAEGR